MMVSICVNPQKSALNDSFREQSPNDSNDQWTCPSLRYPNIILSNRLQPMAIVGVSQSDERASPDEPFIGWRKVLYNRFGRQKRHNAYYTLLYYINIYIYIYLLYNYMYTYMYQLLVCPNMADPIFRSCVSFPIPRKKTAPWILHVPSLSG